MIHQFKQNGYNIVLDVYSGAIHIVDSLIYDIISDYEKLSHDQIIKKYTSSNKATEIEVKNCISDIESLISHNQLFTQDIYKNIKPKLKEKSVIKALCLHVAHTCNLACEYCFAKQGTYHGEDSLMTYEVGVNAIDFLIKNSGHRRNLEVDFFGGEPLLNWQLVKDIVLYARSIEKQYDKNFRFTLTTNGILIDDDVIDFVNKEMHNVVLSLDGRKEVHDKFRVNINGDGSYEKIIPKFKKLIDKRGQQGYYIRGTFTHHNLDFLEDIKHMADLGFKELSIEPVVTDESSSSFLKDEDLPIIYKQYEMLTDEMVKRHGSDEQFNFYHYNINLDKGPCIHKRITGCGSGTEYLAVTPIGDLYPCHQFVNDKEYKMGDVFNGIENENLVEEFSSCNIYSRPDCQDCWAKLFCSGGCPANAYHKTGNIAGIDEYGCNLFRKRIECAIALNVELFDKKQQ